MELCVINAGNNFGTGITAIPSLLTHGVSLRRYHPGDDGFPDSIIDVGVVVRVGGTGGAADPVVTVRFWCLFPGGVWYPIDRYRDRDLQVTDDQRGAGNDNQLQVRTAGDFALTAHEAMILPRDATRIYGQVRAGVSFNFITASLFCILIARGGSDD